MEEEKVTRPWWLPHALAQGRAALTDAGTEDARSADDEALSALYRRWAGPVLQFLERVVRERAMAEELMQETFVRVHGARDRYEPEARFSAARSALQPISTIFTLPPLLEPPLLLKAANSGSHLEVTFWKEGWDTRSKATTKTSVLG